MSLDQIRKYIFINCTQGVVSRRLSKLVNVNLVNRRSHFLNGKNRSLFEITDLGIKTIQSQLSGEVRLKNYKSDSVDHDLELVDIAKRLMSMNLVKKIHYESELRSYSEDSLETEFLPFRSLNSDLAIKLDGEDSDELVAFEYERTSKSKKRNNQKLEDYYLSTSIKAVFYICESRSVMASLIASDKSVSGRFGYSKMYFCLREEFKKQNKQIVFERFDGEKINIL